jgi:hypothetical protein
VAGLGQVHEHRLRAGRRQRRGGLARHVARLADAHAHDLALGLEQHLHRLVEGRPQRLGQPVQRLGLDRQHPPADGDGVEVQDGHIVHREGPEDRSGAMVSTAGPDLVPAAFCLAVWGAGVWPNGPGERAPSPWGQTSARAIISAAAAPINENTTRSDMLAAIPASCAWDQITGLALPGR